MITLYNQNIWNNYPAGYRNRVLRSLVEDFNADVCTFQECGPFANRIAEPSLEAVMGGEYAEAVPEAAMVNYTPVFYRKDRFNLVDAGYSTYDGLNDANSKGVSWVVLEEKATGKRCAFASTHFWYKARGQEDTQQRIENARQLKGICDRIVEIYRIPVIIGGDFNNGKNSRQEDIPYRTMVQWGFRDVRYLAKESTEAEYTCANSYPLLQLDGTFKPCPQAPSFCIDYIFVYGDGNVEVEKFWIENGAKARTASDHCPLICSFQL